MKKAKRGLKKQNDATDTNIKETQIEETTLRLVYRTILYFCSGQRTLVGINNT